MAALAQQQQALLRALWAPGAQAGDLLSVHVEPGWERGLQAYKANASALAERSLMAVYPVLAQLMGADSFAGLAQAFWHARPPRAGDMAQWGAALPTFLADSVQLRDEPYLPDMARLEWALHLAAGGADAPAELNSLALLMSDAPVHGLRLQLASGTALVQSRYPIASIFLAHREPTHSLEQAGLKLRNGQAESALVWRQGYKPSVRLVGDDELGLLNVLLRGDSLGQALDAAPMLDFGPWLTQAVHSGLLLTVLLIDNKGMP